MKLNSVFTLCILLFTFKYASGQAHNELYTLEWKLIALRYETQVKPMQFKVIFPDELIALNNKVIELPGYIIPTKVGNSFSTFMLSIVPIESCPFCGTGDIPSMVEVKMSNPIVWNSKPVKIRGKFIINNSGDRRSEFFLTNAIKL